VTYRRDLTRTALTRTSHMLGGGDAFTIAGAEPGRDAVEAHFGMRATFGLLAIRVGYGAEHRKRLTAHNISGGISLRF
jgi:hypothetical protein